jgi:putative transposase
LADRWDDLLVDQPGKGRPWERVAVVQGAPDPVEVISHCVWLYHRFPLSFREVEELMLECAAGLATAA